MSSHVRRQPRRYESNTSLVEQCLQVAGKRVAPKTITSQEVAVQEKTVPGLGCQERWEQAAAIFRSMFVQYVVMDWCGIGCVMSALCVCKNTHPFTVTCHFPF
jgi:hypothetical protein